jgi:PEGA domain
MAGVALLHLAATAGLGLLSASGAHAEGDLRAVVLPPKVAEEGLEAQGESAAELAAEHLRTDMGLQVTSSLVANHGVADAVRECWTRACALSYKSAFFADMAVVVQLGPAPAGSLASSDASAPPHTCTVRIVASDDEEYEAEAVYGSEADLEKAVESALDEAWQKRKLGPGPWLWVKGSPEGANVALDGLPVGRLPFHGRVGAGDHYVVVRASGYLDYEGAVSVAGGTSSHTNLHVALTPEPQRGGNIRARRTAWDWGVGAALMGIGLPYLVTGLITVARDGDCSERASFGACSDRVDAGGATWAKLAIGSVGVVGGALTMGLAPIGAFIQPRPGGLSVAATWRLR